MDITSLLDFVDIDVGQELDTVVFMAIAIVATLLLLLTLIVGEVFEFFGDALDIDDGGGIFNMQTIAAFLAGFGAIAWLLAGYFDVASLPAALGGLLGGVPMGVSVLVLTRAFEKQSASSGYVLTDLVGETVRVSLSIPVSGAGRVQFERAGGMQTAPARSAGSERIEEGSAVRVESVLAGECIVRPIQ